MMQAIAESLPMALGVALSPLPILAIVMILMTARAGTNAPAFLLGWIIGLLAVGVVVFMIPASQAADGEPTAAAGFIRLALGVLLLFFAFREWMSRPGPDDPVEVPKFLAGLDRFGAGRSLLSGFLLVTLHPKNLPLCAAGAAAVDLNTPTLASQFGAYVVFTLIASSTVALPLVAYLAAKAKAEKMFGVWKDWLIRNNEKVFAVILLIIGGLLVARGLRMVMAAG